MPVINHVTYNIVEHREHITEKIPELCTKNKHWISLSKNIYWMFILKV